MNMQRRVATRKLTSEQRTQASVRLMVIEDVLAKMFISANKEALSTLIAMVAIAAARMDYIVRHAPTALYGFAFTAEEREFIRQSAAQVLWEHHLNAAAGAVAQLDRIEVDGAAATEDEVAFAIIKFARWMLRRYAHG